MKLKILPYNRVINNLNGLTVELFMKKAGENFIIEETSQKVPRCKEIIVCFWIINGIHSD